MSLADQVAAIEAELARVQAENVILRQQLADGSGADLLVELMVTRKLTRGEATLLLRLVAAGARPVDRYTLEAALPSRDHAKDRNVKIVDVLICSLRKKLGAAAIETRPGLGWRISPAWSAVP